MPSACFDAIRNVSTPWKHAEGMSLRYGAVIFGGLTYPPPYVMMRSIAVFWGGN